MLSVLKSDLQCGGRNFLNKDNSVLFSSYETADKSFIYAIENYNSFNVDTTKLSQSLGEQFSLKKLKYYFSILYTRNSQKFDGKLINTDNLNCRLPAHFHENVPWSNDRYNTADIFSFQQFKKFVENLNFQTYSSNQKIINKKFNFQTQIDLSK